LTQLLGGPTASELPANDRALVRLIAATSLRRFGQIERVLAKFIARPLPREAAYVRCILLAAAAQLLFLGTPAHAAIDVAVSLCKEAVRSARFAGLVNAVLRRVAVEGPAVVAEGDAARLNTPDWLWERWRKTYGAAIAHSIGEAHLHEAALDLTVKGQPSRWAERLGGVVLPTGSVRVPSHGRVEALVGYDAGAWWVQDASAALPVRLLGEVADRAVLDICAAPGGKTAQLALAGAHVTALDISPARLTRLRANLSRLNLEATVVEGDATTWVPSRLFDAVVLDAPCLATGTIRRHPDLPHLKRDSDLASLTQLQQRLLDHAVALLAPDGLMVYCTCSLEPEEGEQQIEGVLGRHADFTLEPVSPGEFGIEASWITPKGYLRTLPCHLSNLPEGLRGIDGFFAARIRRTFKTYSKHR
jgi:16S rRNA (cytosine967-C5)-methyltransferase